MFSNQVMLCFVLLDIAALTLYALRVFSFCGNILQMNMKYKFAKPFSLLINNLLLIVVIFWRMPILICYLIVYLAILLQFCLMFQGDIRTFLFGSGNFMFHLMNVQMIVSSIYVLLFGISSVGEFISLFPSSSFITILLVIAILEVFSRMVDLESLRLLLENKGQLMFATTSMMIIDIYLLILSVSYNAVAYSTLTAIFLLFTGFLLFGAFYTSFQHAVRMSMLLEFQKRSSDLERELEQSYEHLDAVQATALTDELTKVRNRRYGMIALSQQLSSNIPGCVCFIDIDNLKAVNDQYGHDEGDHYILRVVQVLKEVLNQSDTLVRLGGDEFLLLRPFQSEVDSIALLERVRRDLSSSASKYYASISYGILELGTESRISVSEVLRQADAKMYSYKVNRSRISSSGTGI